MYIRKRKEANKIMLLILCIIIDMDSLTGRAVSFILSNCTPQDIVFVDVSKCYIM